VLAVAVLAVAVAAGADVHVWTLEAPDGDRLARLETIGAGADYAVAHHQGTIATPEQLAALRRVDSLLVGSAPTLPASAWADRDVKAYVPSHYAACINTQPPKSAPQVLAMLPARAAQLLRDKPAQRPGSIFRKGARGARSSSSAEPPSTASG
jgi:hypothetical protein